MKINYWDCKYNNYDESWDGENEDRFYGCTHKKGVGVCDKNNIWGGAVDECKLAKKE